MVGGGVVKMSELETSDTVRKRAYEIWESEGRPHGRHIDHWLQAESELQHPARKSVKPSRRTKAAKQGAPGQRAARKTS